MGRLGWLTLVLAALCAGCKDRHHSVLVDGLLLVDPSALEFERVVVFDERQLRLQLTNAGSGPLIIQQAWVEGDEASFSVASERELVSRVVSGDSAGLWVRFSPRTVGQKSGLLKLKVEGKAVQSVPLTGLALRSAVEPSAQVLDFGRIEVGSKKELTLSFTNVSLSASDVHPRLVGANADEFSTNDLHLESGKSGELKIWFRPTRVGIKAAALSISPCADCADLLVTLLGEGLEQAVVAVPPLIDFGSVPIDRENVVSAKVKNISTEPATLTGLFLGVGTDPSFSFTPSIFPWVMAPGEERIFQVRYSPGHLGAAKGGLSVGVVSARHPTTDVQLKGFGGAPELCVSPKSHDFGVLPVGAKVKQTVSLRNCGSSNTDPLMITGISLTSVPGGQGDDEFSLNIGKLPRTLSSGEKMTFDVIFEPQREGPAAAQLWIDSNGFGAAGLSFRYTGNARPYSPCQLTVTPSALDFGTVPPGRGAVLGIKLFNSGVDTCAVKNIRISDSEGGAFFLPGGEITGHLFPPGTYSGMGVAFRSPGAGDYKGTLTIEEANPADPVVTLPLTAHSQDSCLMATPPFLDFGVSRPDCPAHPMRTRVQNSCPNPVQLRDVYIGPGATDGEFNITAVPNTPRVVAPTDALSIEVSYAAQVPGLQASPMFLDVVGLSRPLLVPLVGESSMVEMTTDTFTQQDGQKVDVLFVVDNSASMVEEHPRLVQAMGSFVDAASRRGVDLHVGVTTTGIDLVSNACPGGAEGGEAGRLFPVDGSWPRIVTLATASVVTVLQHNVQVGECALLEQGFEAARRALTPPLIDGADDPRTPQPNDGNLGFLRNEAGLALVFVSDEDDHSPDDVDTYASFFRTVKGQNQPQRATAFAIAPTASGCPTAGGIGVRYSALVQKTGGAVLSACASDYSPLLDQVANRAFYPQSSFPLSALPDTSTFQVTVDGASGQGWHYDSAANAITFDVPPASGSQISVSYRRSCG